MGKTEKKKEVAALIPSVIMCMNDEIMNKIGAAWETQN